MRLARQTSDHEGPLHPVFTKFHLRRSVRRICHFYHSPSHLHRRFEEIIDVIAIPSVMATSSCSVWEENSPESLFILASKCILAHPDVLFRVVQEEDDDGMHNDFDSPNFNFDQVHEGIVLPSEICDYLLQTMTNQGLDIDDGVAKAFSDPDRSKLRRLELRDSNITDLGFRLLAKHNLRDLRIFNCKYLTEILSDMNNHSDNLVELSIEPARRILPR